MPRFHFHVRTSLGVEADDDGIPFQNLEAATEDARASLFEMIADQLATGRRTTYLGIDISDDLGTVLAVVTVDDAIDRNV
ncbi:DUF6894 family protein [Pararhizobium sp.]|uniref:DUF6894 family protein n=1 Tax=Pararhizobium sp. TaxID=1977563 RepID=UPI00071513E6|nr:hypothetical protein ASD32_12605 [Rhizobium sp. Root483D2]